MRQAPAAPPPSLAATVDAVASASRTRPFSPQAYQDQMRAQRVTWSDRQHGGLTGLSLQLRSTLAGKQALLQALSAGGASRSLPLITGPCVTAGRQRGAAC